LEINRTKTESNLVDKLAVYSLQVFMSSGCPVDHTKMKSKGECPVDHSNVNPHNMMPNLNQEKQPGQMAPLPTERTTSSIKNTNTNSNWEYPSPQVSYIS
jgi:cytochrome c heme-lyase